MEEIETRTDNEKLARFALPPSLVSPCTHLTMTRQRKLEAQEARKKEKEDALRAFQVCLSARGMRLLIRRRRIAKDKRKAFGNEIFLRQTSPCCSVTEFITINFLMSTGHSLHSSVQNSPPPEFLLQVCLKNCQFDLFLISSQSTDRSENRALF
jgi:hypothetical protein